MKYIKCAEEKLSSTLMKLDSELSTVVDVKIVPQYIKSFGESANSFKIVSYCYIFYKEDEMLVFG